MNTAPPTTLVHAGFGDAPPPAANDGGVTVARTYVTLKATALIAVGAGVIGGIVGWMLRDAEAERELDEEREAEERRRKRRRAA